MTVYDVYNTSWELRASPRLTAILPVGALEAYGPHLPVDTQTRLLDAIARRVAEELAGDVLLLPTLPFGQSEGVEGLPGTVSLSWRTLLSVIADLGDALRQTGVQRLAVLVGLGGVGCTTVLPREQRIVKTAVRRLNYDHPDLDALWVQPLTVAEPRLDTWFATAADDVHGGEVVTSLMQHLYPDLVGPGAQDHVPPQSAACLDVAPLRAVCPQGVWGYPSRADASKAPAALQAIVAGTTRYIQDTMTEMARLKRHPH
jgi:creatinine amidohydrolase